MAQYRVNDKGELTLVTPSRSQGQSQSPAWGTATCTGLQMNSDVTETAAPAFDESRFLNKLAKKAASYWWIPAIGAAGAVLSQIF